jgi:uncharacterized protein (TIGR02996 family)
MNEREALLRAVCEHPDDDTPRLVFADWLDENGEPDRAEFIRLQIAVDRTPGYPDRFGPEHRELIKRIKFDLFRGAWENDLPLPGPDAPVWKRGFIETIRCTVEAWRSACKVVFALHPVQRVEFTDIEDGASLEVTHEPGHTYPWRLSFFREIDEVNYRNEDRFNDRDELVAGCSSLLSTWLQGSDTLSY